MVNEHCWKQYWVWLTASFAMMMAGLALFVAIIDPYDILPFSPDIERVPMTMNQRFGYPSVARKAEFDSVVIGTSTTRLLQTSVLNKGLNANFAILSMDSATTYEQFKILQQFITHRDRVKHVIIGVDAAWCQIFSGEFNIYTSRPFPEWMYDTNPWNDFINHFTLKTVETALKQALFIAGIQPGIFARNGYQNFLLDDSEYDLDRARELIYGSKDPKPFTARETLKTYTKEEVAELPFKALDYVHEIFGIIDEATDVTLVMVPFHYYRSSKNRANLDACMQRIQAISKLHPRVFFIDFAIASSLTMRDENYWDPLHYRLQPSFDVTQDIVDAIRTRKENQFQRYHIVN